MAKLKTRTNQPVVDEEGLLEHIAQEGAKTVIGGNLDVDGTLTCQGGQEVVTSAQAVIDEGNPELALKQGETIVEMVDINPLLANGEKMEGYSFEVGSAKENIALTLSYAGIVKNGNKLTFACSGKVIRSGEVSGNNFVAGVFITPSSIGDKIFNTTIGDITAVLFGEVSFMKDYVSTTKLPILLLKDSNSRYRLMFYQNQVLTLNTEYAFRFETTILLSDNLVG